MASNVSDPSTKADDEYQVQNEDEEDDERTIEEEERLNSDDEHNELDDLQADADMPLEELLKLYSQKGSACQNSSQEEEEEAEEEEEYDDEDETNSSSDVVDRPHPFHQLLQPNGESLAEDDDTDDSSFELEVIKVIRVGEEYQAHVEATTEFDPTNDPTDDREVPVDELFWSSSSANELGDEKIDEYLKTIHEEFPSSDDEISLQTLLHCKVDPTLALVQFRQSPVKTMYSYREWSSDEIQRFEDGLREYRKDFFKICVNKCPDRTVREIVHFYYQWKKTERYRTFIEEQQQRLNAMASVTDIIEKFFEEQEQQLCTAVGVINPTNSSSSTTSFLSNEFKRQSPNSSISIVTIHQQETMKRSLDQIDPESEPTAKKAALNPPNSSTSTTTIV